MKKNKFLTVNTTIGKMIQQLSGSAIFDEKKLTINGVPIDQIHSRSEKQFKLPLGYSAACHICKPMKLFRTIDECTDHVADKHMVWRGKQK
jgi:hypothetical protein